MRRCLFIAVICGFVLTLAAHAQEGPKDAVVIIIRHADDADSGDGLSPLGQERAEAYKNYFLNFTVDSKPREPDRHFCRYGFKEESSAASYDGTICKGSKFENR